MAESSLASRWLLGFPSPPRSIEKMALIVSQLIIYLDKVLSLNKCFHKRLAS